MGLPDGRKSFKIGLVILIQYRLWQTPTHPASQPATQPATQPRRRSIYRAYYVARVKIMRPVHIWHLLWITSVMSISFSRLIMSMLLLRKWAALCCTGQKVRWLQLDTADVDIWIGLAFVYRSWTMTPTQDRRHRESSQWFTWLMDWQQKTRHLTYLDRLADWLSVFV